LYTLYIYIHVHDDERRERGSRDRNRVAGGVWSFGAKYVRLAWYKIRKEMKQNPKYANLRHRSINTYLYSCIYLSAIYRMSQRYVLTTLSFIFLFDLRFCDLTIEAGRRLQNEDNSKYSILFFILNLNEFIKTFVNCFFFVKN